MARKKKASNGEGVSESAQVIGMFRVNILEDGKIVGDSGWRKNLITNNGAQYYLVENLIGSTGSRRVSYMGIGTGGSLSATSTTIDGEISTNTNRPTVSASIVASRTAQFTAQFASTVFSTRGGASNISNIGLFYDVRTGDIFCGNTYTSSQWNTNQDVNATYQVRFPVS